MRQHALGHSPAHFFPTFRCRGLRRRAKLGEAIPREAGRSETRSSRRQRPWGGSCIPARHQINQRCHRRTRGSDAKSSSTKRKTRSGLNDPSDRVAVAAPEDFAAPSTNDRICDCGGAWKAAAAQQTYFCERAQRELGISATGSKRTCGSAAGTLVRVGLWPSLPAHSGRSVQTRPMASFSHNLSKAREPASRTGRSGARSFSLAGKCRYCPERAA